MSMDDGDDLALCKVRCVFVHLIPVRGLPDDWRLFYRLSSKTCFSTRTEGWGGLYAVARLIEHRERGGSDRRECQTSVRQ